MAGKRQHFIPKFLQEGFVSHTNGDQSFTWVYRKNSEPFNTNVINVGVEGSFYTVGSDTITDDLITSAEISFSRVIRTLRTSSPGRVSDPEIPAMIAHLEVRTRHLRQSMLLATNYMISRLLDFVSDMESFAQYLERAFRNDPTLLRNAFRNELSQRGMPETMVEPMLQLTSPLVPVLVDLMKPSFPQFAEQLRQILPDFINKGAKDGHINALKKGISPDVRRQRYESLIYTVVDVSGGGLILGDSAVLFHVEAQRGYKPFLDKDDPLIAVVLPLTDSRLLVGIQGDFNVREHQWRQAIARCSLEYFIAKQASLENHILRECIGEDASPLTNAELEEIITEAISK